MAATGKFQKCTRQPLFAVVEKPIGEIVLEVDIAGNGIHER